MDTATSADGSVIGYEITGSGRPLICVPPAFSLRGVFDELAAELSDSFTVVRYDRRGRGDSTDAIAAADVAGYRVDRELEDLAAVNAAVGGNAALLGHSSGGQLALAAAATGAYAMVAAYEPPFDRDGSVRTELVDKLIGLITADRPGDAVATFQTEGIGLPAQMVEQIRQSPIWPGLEAIGQTVVYDATLTADPRPTAAIRSLAVPVLCLAGADTWPMLLDATKFAAEEINGAEYVEVPGGAEHQLAATGVAQALRSRWAMS